jgi:heme-degrading monooxygenase HmoA
MSTDLLAVSVRDSELPNCRDARRGNRKRPFGEYRNIADLTRIDMSNVSPAFCAIYRWRLQPDSEEIFMQAWSRITQLLLTERGSLGSRLHRGADNIWYSYTQWPSAEAKAEGLARASVDAEAWQRLRECIAESLPELVLEPVWDFLAPLPHIDA